MELWKIGVVSTVSILSYNILQPDFFVTLIIAGILSAGFFYFEEKRNVILYMFIFSIYWIVSGVFIFNGELEKGSIYSAKGEFNGKNIILSSINGKGGNIIFKENSGDRFKGRAELLIKIDNIEKIKNRYLLRGKIIEIKKDIFDKTRDYLSEKIKNISENKKIHGITNAVILGDNSGLTDEMQKSFRYTGTAHIIVISGMHIALIILAILKIAEMLKLGYKTKYITSILILSGYCFTVGMTPPVARSYIMGLIYLLSKLLWEKAEMDKSFWIAYLGILFFNPEQLFSLSFQLSFGAVFAMIYIYELIKNEKDNFFIEMLKLSFIIQLVLSPLFVIYFGTMPILSIFANMVAIPLGTVMIQFMFGAVFITALFSIFDGILKIILNYLVEIMIFYVKLFEKIPFMQVEINSAGAFIFIILYLIFTGMGVRFVMKKKEERINSEKIILNIEKVDF